MKQNQNAALMSFEARQLLDIEMTEIKGGIASMGCQTCSQSCSPGCSPGGQSKPTTSKE